MSAIPVTRQITRERPIPIMQLQVSRRHVIPAIPRIQAGPRQRSLIQPSRLHWAIQRPHATIVTKEIIQQLQQIVIPATLPTTITLQIQITRHLLLQRPVHNAILQIQAGNLQHIHNMIPNSSRFIQEGILANGPIAAIVIQPLIITFYLIVNIVIQMFTGATTIQMHSVTAAIQEEWQGRNEI